MRPHHDDRRDRTRPGDPEARHGAEATEPAPETAVAGVLALQRTAGNAAVGGMLQARGAKLARDRRLPEDPHSLGEVAPAAAKEMQFDTDDMGLGDLHRWFKGPRGPDREGVSINVRFGADLAAKPDPKAEKRLHDGLAGIAVAAFHLQGGDDRPVITDTVRTRDLDLTPFGGKDGHYRFTAVTRTKRGGKPSELDLIIELLGARPAELKTWKSLTSQRRLELQNRFAKPGYTQAQSTLTKSVDTWTDDQFGSVLQALEAIPESTLATVPDIVWERGHGKLGPTGEAGYFEQKGRPAERHLTLYDDAFSSDAELVEVIAHEIGHAISFRPTTATPASKALAQTPEFKQAITADGGKAVTAYGGKNLDEHFAEAYSLYITEPDTLKSLRPHVFAYLSAKV